MSGFWRSGWCRTRPSSFSNTGSVIIAVLLVAGRGVGIGFLFLLLQRMVSFLLLGLSVVAVVLTDLAHVVLLLELWLALLIGLLINELRW